MTIKQLLQAESTNEETLRVDGHELHHARIVGQIVTVAESATYITLTLDDGTGTIECRIWMDSDANPADASLGLRDYNRQKKSELRELVYVAATGYLKSFNNRRSFIAKRVRPITDYNEITYHNLEALYVHLHRLKHGSEPSMAYATSNYYTSTYQGGDAMAMDHGYGAPADYSYSSHTDMQSYVFFSYSSRLCSHLPYV